MTDYYNRATTTHIDGTPVFATDSDRNNQHDTAHQIEQEWRCQLHEFGALSPIDYYATRAGRLAGLLEIKARTHTTTTHPTVYLNVRKWLALTLGEAGLGCPAVYVVRFTDQTCWIRVADIDATHHRIAGCREIVKARSDIEPVIAVPVATMKVLGPPCGQPVEEGVNSGRTLRQT